MKNRKHPSIDDHGPNEEFLPQIAKVISKFGEIYNGFEAEGLENIPQEGPALLVFYHGLVPLDAWYFGLQYYLKTGRLIRGLGDRWLFKTPGLAWLCRAVGGVPGNPVVAKHMLETGHLVGVSPGGVREAISGHRNHYKLLWGKRVGFARLALEAKVPIIPAFTENVEEMYRSPLADHPFFQSLYEKTRLPLVPIVGLGLLPFPVKIKTHVGKPIPYDPSDTPETLREKTRVALNGLISKNQRPNSTISEAMLRRIR